MNTMTDTTDDRISARAKEIAEREMATLLDNTTASAAMFERAKRSMPGGVASSFQLGDPYPIYLAGGKGAEVTDVDGRTYYDFHNGFGSMAVGHANPIVADAIERAARTGTHFAVTTEAAVALAEELCRRFRVDQVRMTNSGTESTGTCIRVARAATGRDVICKIEGSYHGHVDQLMYSVLPGADVMGGRDEPATVPKSKGVPAGMAQWIRVVPFNDAEAFERLLQAEGEQIAAIIMEPVMMNIGIVLPRPGYLEAMRKLCTQYGVVLIFDEVKCGATIAAGGAAERFGVQPDLASWAKAIGGGTAIGAFGGKAEIMDQINQGATPGHLQRQPPLGRSRSRDAHPGPHAAGLRALRIARASAVGRHERVDRRQRDPGPHHRPRLQGVRVLPPGAVDELPGLPRDEHRPLPRLLSVDDQPGCLHDPG